MTEDSETKKLQDKLGYADIHLTTTSPLQKQPRTNSNIHVTIREPKPQRPIPALEKKRSFREETPMQRSNSLQGECVCQKKMDTRNPEDIKEMASRLYEMADRMLQSLSLEEKNKPRPSSSTPIRRSSTRSSPDMIYRQNYPEYMLPPPQPRVPLNYYYYAPIEYDNSPLDYYYVPRRPRRRKSMSQVSDEEYTRLKRKNSKRMQEPVYDAYYYDYYY
ncbi:hypothetical protein BCV72DRAFT_95321 [Rhizopus microsporus var. microsporus]|uniref:Uncharacterized protein n=2 Tax=Rhizopus microsporus TaxID=58291 RepID=A0A2G4SIK3_RHIZD|nr:uncharacterized protein RHIMIDRAFT_247540 [Rhizopus microsporus ATCC 52813]ORE08159.1 hypothetical protein BCV72DRAFT_95321 [Rhizopus microsporus var. microsporus]PHZ08604.1 hypothetical protein RHIMIDRAFT_247540 [Rhizopus microsporus ATCC 52813]